MIRLSGPAHFTAAPSPSLRRKNLIILIVLLASLGWSWWHFAAIWKAPNEMMFGHSGDALKNYFTFAWHARSDSSLAQFSGMNHPFGEQINYPDAQPLWSGALWLVIRVWPGAAHYAVGYENMLMLLAPVITALCFLLLLAEFRVTGWSAVVCAFGAMTLEPQMVRVVGHFGLSYGWAIPLVLLLYLRLRRRARHGRAAVGLFLVVLGLLWTHPYLGFIPWCLVLLTFAVDTALNWSHWRGRRAWSMAAALAGPMIIFLSVQALTDHHIARTQHPLGFVDLVTDLRMLTHSFWGMDNPLSRALLGSNEDLGFEGTCYLGLATLTMLPVALVVLGRRIFRDGRRTLSGHSQILAPLFLAALLLVVYAMGIPFIWGLEAWVWKIPGVAQFRSAGRFAWPAYWVLFLVAVLTARSIRRTTGGAFVRRASMLPLLFVSVMPIYEGYYHYRSVSAYVGEKADLFLEHNMPPEERAMVLAAGNIQGCTALLPLPWMHYGSDEFLVPADGAQEPALLLAYHRALPIMANVLPKVSLEETRMLINLMGPPWYPHPIAHHLDPNTRILVLRMKTPLPPVDSMIVARSKLVADLPDRQLLTLEMRDLLADRTAELVRPFPAIPTGGIVLWDHFDDRSAAHRYHGSGALQLPHMVNGTFAVIPAGTLVAGRVYTASFWFFNRGPLRCLTAARVERADAATGVPTLHERFDLRTCRIMNGDWSMAELEFTAGEATIEHRLVLQREEWLADSVWVDELLIRRSDVRVDSIFTDPVDGSRELFHNGHFLAMP